MKLLAVLSATVAALAMTVPASAAPITYTFSGNITGVFNNQNYDVFAVFTGMGDTSLAQNNGFSTYVPLSSLSILSGGTTYNITTPAGFARLNNSVGLLFDLANQGANNYFGGTLASGSYNGLSSIGPIGLVNPGFQASFDTDLGPATVTGGGAFTFTAVTSAVPEPATWALMIAGFGMVGGAMRRRQTMRTTISFA